MHHYLRRYSERKTAMYVCCIYIYIYIRELATDRELAMQLSNRRDDRITTIDTKRQSVRLFFHDKQSSGNITAAAAAGIFRFRR